MPFLSLSPYNFRNLCNENIDLSSKEKKIYLAMADGMHAAGSVLLREKGG